MSKHTLLVCKSCHRSSEELAEDQQSDGILLLNKLNMYSSQFQSDEVEIQPLECLWACSQGCVVSVSAPGKPTFLLANLPGEDSAAGLMEFMKLYVKNRKGSIPWKRLPEFLQSAIYARIPPATDDKRM
jgi:predicted metal-binding protein